MNPLLSVKNLRVRFKTGKNHFFEALSSISFDVLQNQTVAIVGESGSGKSVCALAIMGLLPEAGCEIDQHSQIVFENKNLLDTQANDKSWVGRDIAIVFQDPMSSLNPVFTVGFQIEEVLRLQKKMSHLQARQRAIDLLGEVGIPEPEKKINAFPHELSGGQQQRVMIAMAIACEPKLLIADEPTTALDVTIQKQIMDLLKTLQIRRQMSVLFITHDLQLVSEIADKVIVMRRGEIKEHNEARTIFTQPVHDYTKALLLCRPTLDKRPFHLPVIDEYMQSSNISSGLNRVKGWTDKDEIILDVKHLSTVFEIKEGLFKRRLFKAVDDVSFVLPKQKTLGIVGESGSGKTTLGLTVMRLIQASAGEVWFRGQNILTLDKHAFYPIRKKLQIIFQNPYASLNPRMTVGDILLEPMIVQGIGKNREEQEKAVLNWLDRVGLPKSVRNRYPHEFSGGQRQRIAIARCLTVQPEILVCDESVSALDVSIQAQILNLLQDLQDELGLSYIFISHDLSVVKYISDQVLVMRQGKAVELANSDEIYQNPQHPYTKLLLSAIPRDPYSQNN